MLSDSPTNPLSTVPNITKDTLEREFNITSAFLALNSRLLFHTHFTNP